MNHKLVIEYKSIRARDFFDVALFHCARIRWMLQKIESGELVKDSELYHYIRDLPGVY